MARMKITVKYYKETKQRSARFELVWRESKTYAILMSQVRITWLDFEEQVTNMVRTFLTGERLMNWSNEFSYDVTVQGNTYTFKNIRINRTERINHA